MTPAGWLTGRDLVYRVADALHGIAAAAGRPPISPVDAAKAAEAVLGFALSQPRPPLGAFVRQGGEWFTVPARLWAEAVDAYEAGDQMPLSSALLSPTLPSAFAPYAGQVALYGAENAADFVSRLSHGAAGFPPVTEPGPADAPWLPGKPTPWLMSDASDQWANDRLRAANLRVDERGRRAEFGKAIAHFRANFSESSVATVRDRAGKHLTD